MKIKGGTGQVPLKTTKPYQFAEFGVTACDSIAN